MSEDVFIDMLEDEEPPVSPSDATACSPSSGVDNASQELSSKGQDTVRVMDGDSGFDSPAAHFLRALLDAEDKYGYGASMCHPRVTMARSAARRFLENSQPIGR